MIHYVLHVASRIIVVALLGVALSAPLAYGNATAPSAEVYRVADLSERAHRSASPQEAARIARLAALGRVWGTVHNFHPWLGYRDIDWDGAVMKVIPAVEAAETAPALRAAYRALFAELGDSATFVVEEPAAPVDPPPELLADEQPLWQLTDDKVLIVTMTDQVDLLDWTQPAIRLAEAMERVEEAEAIVFDLRSFRPGDNAEMLAYMINYAFEESKADVRLAAPRAEGPGSRYRQHFGLADSPSNVYWSSFVIRDRQEYASDGAASTPPAAFLVDAGSKVPSVALALQHAGRGVILAEGAAPRAPLVGRINVDVGLGVEVQLRTGELIFADGTGGFQADRVLPHDIDPQAALTQTLGFIRGLDPDVGAARDPLPVTARTRYPSAGDDAPYPDREARLLALYRIWHNVELFFAYKHLMDEPWEPVLEQFIPHFEAASDSLTYALTVCRLMMRLQDGHAYIRSPLLSTYYGEHPASVWVRFVEGRPLITGFRTEGGKAIEGVRIGDEIVELDGEPVQQRIDRLRLYIAASNEWTLYRYVSRRLLHGPEGSTLTLTLRGDDSQLRRATVTRGEQYEAATYRNGEVVRRLDGNIGYIDLERLAQKDIADTFASFADTQGIIFDMRGYTRDFVWPIAAYLGLETTTATSSFRTPIAVPPNNFGNDRHYSHSTQNMVAVTGKPEDIQVYDRPMVMLIDERTQSASEHLGTAFLRGGVVMVGSSTAGANGNVTQFRIPGGITTMFSGMEAMHADGTQLQRVGLIPAVEARPSIRGIRDGRDEVLEAAMAYLQQVEPQDVLGAPGKR